MISWPFGLYDCAAQTDGAAAAIVTRRRPRAELPRPSRCSVRAVASASAPNPQKDPAHDFLRWKPTVAAARGGLRQAGISDPCAQIDVAQLHDCFTLTELLTYEDLGFCAKGAAQASTSRAGTFALGGELPVNTDGGLKAFGHPTAATGVRMVYENVLQLQGRAGPRQVPECDDRAQPQHRRASDGLRRQHPEPGVAHGIRAH